jgi:hypothetical protein
MKKPKITDERVALSWRLSFKGGLSIISGARDSGIGPKFSDTICLAAAC